MRARYGSPQSRIPVRGVANEYEPGRFGLGIAALLAFAAGWRRHQGDQLVYRMVGAFAVCLRPRAALARTCAVFSGSICAFARTPPGEQRQDRDDGRLEGGTMVNDALTHNDCRRIEHRSHGNLQPCRGCNYRS